MASVSDDFNRADGGLGANWTAVAGTWTIASNVATRNAVVGSTPGSARYNTDLATSDNSAQIVVVALNASSDVMSVGAACRFSSSAQTYYFVSLQVEVNGTATINLGKMEAGTLTILASTATLTTSFPETIKVQAVGSTIKAFRGGSEVLSVTDTSITTGTRVGLHGRRRASGAAWSADNFYAEDVGGGPVQQHESGGSTTIVTAVAVGAGNATEASSGGGSTTADINALGNGSAAEAASGGALAVVQVATTGGGEGSEETPPTEQHESGGGSTVAGAVSAGAGVAAETSSGGGSVTVLAVALGAGVAAETNIGGGSSAVLIVSVGGGEQGGPYVERDVTLVRTLPPPITARPLPAAITARRLP